PTFLFARAKRQSLPSGDAGRTRWRRSSNFSRADARCRAVRRGCELCAGREEPARETGRRQEVEREEGQGCRGRREVKPGLKVATSAHLAAHAAAGLLAYSARLERLQCLRAAAHRSPKRLPSPLRRSPPV